MVSSFSLKAISTLIALALVATAAMAASPFEFRSGVRNLVVTDSAEPVAPQAPAPVIANFGTYRAWSDGTYATSCQGYLTPTSPYTYSGVTGDGRYRIDLAGTLTDVDCDMTTDGGGWTLVLSVLNTTGLSGGSGLWGAGTGAVHTVALGTAGYAKLADTNIRALATTAYRLVNKTSSYQATNPKRFVQGSCAYAHNVVGAANCRTTYATLQWTGAVVGDTSLSNRGIGDRNASGKLFYSTNNDMGAGSGATFVGANLAGSYIQWGHMQMWAK